MKSISLKTLTILVILFVTSSCGKDDNNDLDNDTGCSNCFVYQNGGNPQTVQIAKVTYELHEDEMELIFYSNSNERIVIELDNRNNANITEIPTGTFDYTTSPLFFSGVIHTENDGDRNFGIRNIGWKITIAKDQNNYKINFNFTSGVGVTNGNYAGQVEPDLR